jgi:methionine synthase I (cobalamin-dependent)
MADSIIERLGEEILVMSGPMSTMMPKMRAELGGSIGQWIVEHPEVFRERVRDYFRVGGDIVAGATSNLNRISLANFGRAGGELRFVVLRTADGP